jgi:hypothetical protein
MVHHTGACACGSVKYVIDKDDLKSIGVCHCLTCQAWSGGIALFFEAAGPTVKITEGRDNLTSWQSSDYGERVFCKKCGSGLYSRITMPGTPMDNVHHFCAGTLKDWSVIDNIDWEIFIDRKPAVYNLEGTADRKTMTAEEFSKMYSNDDCPTHEKKEDETKG